MAYNEQKPHYFKPIWNTSVKQVTDLYAELGW